ETGTAESQRCIRHWTKHLSTFIHSFDLVKARPLPTLLKVQPEYTLEAAFGIPGQDIAIYLADERELSTARDLPSGISTSSAAGEVISGTVKLDLPEGTYFLTCFDPKTGLSSPGIQVQGGANLEVALPTFFHDLVLHLRRH